MKDVPTSGGAGGSGGTGKERRAGALGEAPEGAAAAKEVWNLPCFAISVHSYVWSCLTMVTIPKKMRL